MIKKRVVLYFLIMAFPMGLGAGAANWIKLPRLPLPEFSVEEKVADAISPVEPLSTVSTTFPASSESDWSLTLPDFSAVHPLVVGAFSLLLCTGILLAADKSTTVKPGA